MTPKDFTILGYALLIFGFAFYGLGHLQIALGFFIPASVVFAAGILLHYFGGGPTDQKDD